MARKKERYGATEDEIALYALWRLVNKVDMETFVHVVEQIMCYDADVRDFVGD